MVETRIRVGLAGAGAVARMHMAAYRGSRVVEVVAFAEIDAGRRAAFAAEFTLKPYDSIGAMLKHERLDLVCVLTPPANHSTAVRECADAGIHVLCEKPLAVDARTADELMKYCTAKSVRLAYGASYRFLPALRRARSLIAEGAIGEVRLMREQEIGGEGLAHQQELGPQHYPKGGPGGGAMGLVDHGIHLIDIFAWLTDSSVTSAFGRGNVSGGPQDVEFALLGFNSGAIGQLTYFDGTFPSDLPNEGIFSAGEGWSANGMVQAGAWNAHPGSISIHGTTGTLRIFHYANALFLISADGTRQIALEGGPAPLHFRGQIEAVARALRDDTDFPASFDDAVQALRVLDALYESAAKRVTIEVRS